MRLACLLVLAGARLAWGIGPAGAPAAAPPSLQAECIRLVTECAAARSAAARDPMVVEHPPGVLFKTTSPAATRHMVNAIAIARGIVQRFGALPPGCARACDGVLK